VSPPLRLRDIPPRTLRYTGPSMNDHKFCQQSTPGSLRLSACRPGKAPPVRRETRRTGRRIVGWCLRCKHSAALAAIASFAHDAQVLGRIAATDGLGLGCPDIWSPVLRHRVLQCFFVLSFPRFPGNVRVFEIPGALGLALDTPQERCRICRLRAQMSANSAHVVIDIVTTQRTTM